MGGGVTAALVRTCSRERRWPTARDNRANGLSPLGAPGQAAPARGQSSARGRRGTPRAWRDGQGSLGLGVGFSYPGWREPGRGQGREATGLWNQDPSSLCRC